MKNLYTPVLLFGLCALLFASCGGKEETPYLTAPTEEIIIPYNGVETTFDIASNVDWTAVSGATWLRVSHDKTTVTLSADASENERRTTVLCRTADAQISATVKVMQEKTPLEMIDSLALVALHSATEGASWTAKWDLSKPLAQWHGVTMDNGRVVELHLSGNNLSGTVPSAFYKLSAMSHLDLSNNKLSGALLSNIGDLSNLKYCDLSKNQFAGDLPQDMRKLYLLSYFDLSENAFTGSLPEVFSTLPQLIMLDISYNNLTGAMPVTMQYLTNVQYLALCNNKLAGAMPDWLKKLTAIRYIDVSFNNFAGKIPDFSTLANLKVLYLYKNAFADTIPAYITTFTKLQEIGLDGNNLTGTIPEDMGNIATLQKLYLSHNRLTGEVPASLLNNPNWPDWEDNVLPQQNGSLVVPGGTPVVNRDASIIPRLRPSKEQYKNMYKR